MKRPSLKFDKQALLGFLLNHGEKFVVGLVGLVGLALVWNGVNALRLKSVRSDQTPEAVSQLTAQTVQHIDAATKPPADAIRKGGDLAAVLDPWRPQQVKIAPAPEMALLDRPLVQELAKRAKPEVLPIEDLRALAGVAVVPDPTDPAAMMQAPGRGPELDAVATDAPPRRPGRRKPGQREEEPAAEQAAAELNPALAAMPRGKVVPYVLVTGLVPVAKQREEYRRAFGGAGFRDPQLDLPRWSQYLVERAQVGPAGAPTKWERLRIKNVESYEQAGGMAAAPGAANAIPETMQQETLPPAFMLASTETDLGYVAQLPQRIDDPWGLEAVHPWFRSQLKKLLEAAPGLLGDTTAVPVEAKRLRDAPDEFDGQVVELDGMQLFGEPQRGGAVVAFAAKTADGAVTFPIAAPPASRQPVFVMAAAWARTLELDNGPKRDTTCRLRVRMEKLGNAPVARILGITFPGGEGETAEELADPAPFPFSTLGGGGGEFAIGGMGDAAGGMLDGAEFRMFRFLDTAVKPGARYRYRVRLSVRNPNFGIDRQYLADPASAKGELLPSPESNETPPVSVPDGVSLLVQTLSKDEIKEMKVRAGSVQLLVLAPSDKTGNYALRSLITETGGLANVDSSLNKPGDTRTKGDDVTTDRVLVDVRGRQEQSAKAGAPPEPFELLFLRRDGTCEFVSAADSQRLSDRYMPTLEPPVAPAAPAGLEERPFEGPTPRRGANR